MARPSEDYIRHMHGEDIPDIMHDERWNNAAGLPDTPIPYDEIDWIVALIRAEQEENNKDYWIRIPI